MIVLVAFVVVGFLTKKIVKVYKSRKADEYDFNLNNPVHLHDDQHVNSMQVNGYENPAYKLYEQHVVA